MDEDGTRMVQRDISFVPGLYKIFDEIIGNIYIYIYFWLNHKKHDKERFTFKGMKRQLLK